MTEELTTNWLFPNSRKAACIIGALLLPAGPAATQESTMSPLEIMRVPEVAAAMSACAPDVTKFCAAVKRGEGRIVRCLMENASQIDPACAAGMLKAKHALAAKQKSAIPE